MGAFSYAWVSLVVTSAMASTATAPYAIFHFDRIAGMGLVANLLAMPIITFITAPLAAFTLIAAPFGFGDFGLRLFGLSLEAVLAIAHACANVTDANWAVPRRMPEMALVFFSLAMAMGMMAAGWTRLVLSAALCVPAFWLWLQAPKVIVHWSASGDVFVHGPQGSWTRYSLADGDGLAPLRYAGLTEISRCDPPWCELATEAGLAILNTDPSNPTIAIASGDQQIMLDWSNTLTAGGVTVFADREGQLDISTPSCRHRRWQICPSRTDGPAPRDGPG